MLFFLACCSCCHIFLSLAARRRTVGTADLYALSLQCWTFTNSEYLRYVLTQIHHFLFVSSMLLSLFTLFETLVVLVRVLFLLSIDIALKTHLLELLFFSSMIKSFVNISPVQWMINKTGAQSVSVKPFSLTWALQQWMDCWRSITAICVMHLTKPHIINPSTLFH